MKNIYNKPLQSCGNRSMGNGSWDSEFKCSELGGGVHQICIRDIANSTSQFSKTTGQSDWSERRNGNHCVCLGAYALYSAKHPEEHSYLQCDAIPNTIFTNNYDWNKWNGIEMKNQKKYAIDNIMKQCYDNTSDENKKALLSNYKKMNS